MRSPGQPFDVRAALAAELRAAADALAAASKDDQAVHRCRVNLKRARALARVSADAAPGLQAVFDESARNAMRALAPARVLAALIQAATKAARRARKRAAKALLRTADHLKTARLNAEAPDYSAIQSVLRDLLALAHVWPETSTRQIVRGCRQVAHRARRARRRAMASGAAASTRHEWRKRENDRRHAADLLGAAWPRAAQGHRAQKTVAALGNERDLHLLIKRIAETPALAGGDAAARRAIKALTRRKRKFTRRANRIGATLKL